MLSPRHRKICPCLEIFLPAPLRKKDGDINWRLLHNSLVSPVLKSKMNSNSSPLCPSCDSLGTLIHMFIECPSLKEMSVYIEKILKLIHANITMNVKLFLFHIFPERASLTKSEISIIDFILTLAKSKIYKSYMSDLSEAENGEKPITLFRDALEKKVKQAYYLHCTIEKRPSFFTDFWGPIVQLHEDGDMVLKF
jgi:hypothetical protein